MIEFHTAWDDEDHIYLHWGTAEIGGFLYRYAVESHSEKMSEWDREQILGAFRKQIASVANFHEAPGRLQ